VIGRNQNPWVEINFRQCRGQLLSSSSTNSNSNNNVDNAGYNGIDFLRRRSGGGAVFHDAGNLNFSVISPKTEFTRNKHAEMVVRALKRCSDTRDGISARVNDRHDIVLDVPTSPSTSLLEEEEEAEPPIQTLKISGSAYRLTRSRALHHGTCLVSSPNLRRISGILRSPTREYILAKGVESVRSKVGNVSNYIPEREREGLMERVKGRILEEFRVEYGLHPTSEKQGDGDGSWYRKVTEEECLTVEDIRKGIEELKVGFSQTLAFIVMEFPG